MADELNKKDVIDTENSGADPNAEETDQEQKKTYTQAEIDSMIEAAKAAQKKKLLPPKEEMDAFRAWQAEQKKNQPEDQQAAEYKSKYEAAQAELQAYKNRETVVSKGVNPKFAEFVAFEVQKLVDDSTDFEDALTTWLKTNTQYAAQEDTATAVAGGMRHQKSPQKTASGVADAFYARNPDLKPKE